METLVEILRKRSGFPCHRRSVGKQNKKAVSAPVRFRIAAIDTTATFYNAVIARIDNEPHTLEFRRNRSQPAALQPSHGRVTDMPFRGAFVSVPGAAQYSLREGTRY